MMSNFIKKIFCPKDQKFTGGIVWGSHHILSSGPMWASNVKILMIRPRMKIGKTFKSTLGLALAPNEGFVDSFTGSSSTYSVKPSVSFPLV